MNQKKLGHMHWILGLFIIPIAATMLFNLLFNVSYTYIFKTYRSYAYGYITFNIIASSFIFFLSMLLTFRRYMRSMLYMAYIFIFRFLGGAFGIFTTVQTLNDKLLAPYAGFTVNGILFAVINIVLHVIILISFNRIEAREFAEKEEQRRRELEAKAEQWKQERLAAKAADGSDPDPQP